MVISMMQTVIFDIDNTLYDYDAAHAVAFQALCAYVQKHLGLSEGDFVALHHCANTVLQQRTGGNCAATHSRLIRYQIILEQADKPIVYAPRMEQLYWSTLIDAAVPNPGALDCLQQLKQAGIRLGIGTDMTANWQYAKLERMGMLPLLDFIVTSEEITAEKPDERFFRLCLEKAGCRADECAFVGDSWKKDVLGAQHVGMCPVWFHPQEADACTQRDGVRSVRRLDEIPPLLLDRP